MDSLQTIFLLLLAAVLLVGIAQKFHVPYPIVLVLGGALMGFIPHLTMMNFKPNMILVLVLPPVLYYAAFGTAFREFQHNWKNIFSLALGLVTCTTVIVGLIFKWLLPQFPWALAFAFGAIVSPPDAISATTILKRFSMNPRLISLLEGESLINDASAIVLYNVAVTALLAGSFSWMQAEMHFLQAVLGGVILGLASGFVLQLLSRRYLEPVLGAVFSFTIPYATYIIASLIGVSGVIAVVVNGLVGSRILVAHHSSLRRVVGYATWDVFIILLNCFVFILIGLQLKNITKMMPTPQLILYTEYSLLIVFVMIVVRFLWVYAESLIFSTKLRDATVIAWSGMRGIVSLAAAIGLPYTYPDGAPLEGRDEVVFMTFVVIMTTLLIPGLSLATLIRWLKLQTHSVHGELHQIRKHLAKIADEKLQHFLALKSIDQSEFDFLRTYFVSQYRILEISHPSDEKTQAVERIRQEIIQSQRNQLLAMWKQELISDRVLTHLEQELDLITVHIARAELQ
jgi:Na+/H+ antiporter